MYEVPSNYNRFSEKSKAPLDCKWLKIWLWYWSDIVYGEPIWQRRDDHTATKLIELWRHICQLTWDIICHFTKVNKLTNEKEKKDMLWYDHMTFDSEIVPVEIPCWCGRAQAFFRYKSGTSRSMEVKFHCRIYVHFQFVFNMSKNDSFVEILGFMLNFVRHFVSWNPANDGLMLPQDHL